MRRPSSKLVPVLEDRAGRLLWGGWPPGSRSHQPWSTAVRTRPPRRRRRPRSGPRPSPGSSGRSPSRTSRPRCSRPSSGSSTRDGGERTSVVSGRHTLPAVPDHARSRSDAAARPSTAGKWSAWPASSRPAPPSWAPTDATATPESPHRDRRLTRRTPAAYEGVCRGAGLVCASGSVGGGIRTSHHRLGVPLGLPEAGDRGHAEDDDDGPSETAIGISGTLTCSPPLMKGSSFSWRACSRSLTPMKARSTDRPILR